MSNEGSPAGLDYKVVAAGKFNHTKSVGTDAHIGPIAECIRSNND